MTLGGEIRLVMMKIYLMQMLMILMVGLDHQKQNQMGPM
jgi:hypothetical protein